MEIERPKTKKKKKTRTASQNDEEDDFHDLSIDFPSIDSVNETDLDDLKELQALCADQKVNCNNVSQNKESIDDVSTLENDESLEENTEQTIDGEIQEEVPSAPVESLDIVQPKTKLKLNTTTLYPDLLNLQSITAMTSTMQISEKILSPLVVKPFTPLQIEQLYSNNEIRLVELFENEFVQKELKDASLQEHPLYTLLKKFAKARSRLLQNANNTALLVKRLDESYKKIWRIEKKTAATHGFCPCGKAVRATHDYRFAVFDEDVNSEMERNMKEVQNSSCFNHTKFSQDCALFQRQIEQILGELMNSKAFQNITKNSPVVLNDDLVVSGGNEFDIKRKINDLRLYISILFKFYRESLHDKVLITHLQDWITKLVSLQLRVATWQDHIFILFHILRCPVGIGNWAANLIQVPIMSKNHESPFTLPEFQHCVAILSALLLPIKDRGSFLENITRDLTPHSSKNKEEDIWVLVDSDGEEGSSPTGECIGLKENDLVALFDQIPFDMIFKIMTHAEIRDESVDLKMQKISGNHIIRAVAFASKFIGILKQGLTTYDTERYKQFAKRLGRLMKHTLFYVSDLIKLYHLSDEIYKDPDECARIQVEFDELIIRSAHFIYDSKKLSLFQYLADFPYELITNKSLWKLFYYLHSGDFKVIEEEESLKLNLNISLNDNDIATDDLFFLLHAFARMALAKGKDDWEFVLYITQDLLNIGFIHEATRDYCYNTVKDLISNVTSKHPELIAEIFNYLKGNLQQVGSLSSYLFKALPIDKWRPKQDDLETLASWLLNFDFESIESTTARTIFAYMNWNFDENNQLFLPHDIHIRMAHLVCEVYLKHVGETIGSGINETARQIGSASSKKTPPSKKEQFSIWCWSMISVLRLHFMDINKVALIENPNLLIMIPEVETTQVIYQGFTEQKPLSIYLSLLLSQLGHSIPQICHRGFDQLKLLLNDYRHSKVIRCLELMTPLFVNCQSSLYTCESFINVLSLIFTSDKSYSKMAKEVMTADARGAVVTFFGNMVQHQLTTYAIYGFNSPCEMIKLWTNCLVRLRDWNKDMGVTFVLEIIAQIAYQYPDAWNNMREILRGSVVKIADTKIPKTSGIMTLITSEEKDILMSPFDDMPTLSLMLLELEFENIELNTGMFNELICQLAIQGKQTLANILKKVLISKQLPLFPPSSLVIFKIAKLINGCNKKHFLFPIICQQFFQHYLTRVSMTEVNDHGVQDKFYDNDIGLMKKLKKTFGEAENYHSKMATEITSGSRSHFHTNCAKIFKTYLLWLEENQLNKMTQQNIILPPQYDHAKLRHIFHGTRSHWTEYIYLPDLRSSQKADCNSWLAICFRYTPDLSKYSEKMRQMEGDEEESIEKIKTKIYERLQISGKPLDPPELIREQTHIGVIDLSKSTMQLLKNESKILQNFAHQFNMMVSEQKAVDAVYRDSVRYAYMNEPSFRMKSVSCSRLLDNCQGSTTVKLEFSEMKINDAVRTKLEDNREFYKRMVQRNSKQPDMKIVDANFCVHNVIQQLLDRYDNHCKRGEKEQCESIMKIVTGFFYEMLKEINEEIQECPVTHELYSTTISKLGSLVQQNHNTEGINLLKLALQRPSLVNLIADLFTPSVSSPVYFLEMYKCLVDSYAKRCDPQLLFVLFSKFDMTTWLQTHKPKLIEASNLIQLIIRGLELWNFQNSNLLQDLLQCHLVSLFMYRFPEHYGEILQYILTGFSQQRLKADILLDLINVLHHQAGCGKLNTEMSLNRIKDEMRNFASKQTLLQYNEIHSTMLMLSHHFYNERLQHGLHGVYPKFSEYCDVLCLLFGSMSHALVAAAIQSYPGIIADQLINWLWPSTSEMFAPWLVPYYPQNMKDAPATWIKQFNTSVLQPWSDVHSESAGKIIRVFAMCLQYNLDMLPASNLLLGNLFSWYDGYFAHKTTPKHVLVPIQTLLMKMPFERFRPGHQHMEGIARILVDFVPDCHLFIGNIFLRIPWTTWLQQNLGVWDFMTAQRILAILLMSFVKLSYEPKVRESIRILQLLQEASKYPWYFLEYKDVESVLDWFVMSAEPSVILKIPSEHETIDTNLLILLQVATCMKEFQPRETQSIQPSVLIAKRMAYVRSTVRLLRGCDAKLHQLMSTKQGKDLFNEACGALLNLIDTCFLNADDSKTSEIVNLVVTILQGMAVPESTGGLFADGIKLWQSTCQTGNIVLCSFLNALKIEKHWTLHTFKVLESSLFNYMRVSELTPTHNPSWPDAYKRFELYVNFDHQLLIDNDLFLSLHLLSYIKLLNLTDDHDRVEFIQDVQSKLALRKTSEETEANASLVWAFLIMSGGHMLKRSVAPKNQLLIIARYIQINLTQPEGWGEGLLGAIGLKRDAQTNKKKILLRCFSCAIFALFIAPGSQTLASANEFDGAMTELKNTLSNKKYGDVRMQALQAISLIENRKDNMIDQLNDTITKMLRMFYHESFLNSIEYFYHW